MWDNNQTRMFLLLEAKSVTRCLISHDLHPGKGCCIAYQAEARLSLNARSLFAMFCRCAISVPVIRLELKKLISLSISSTCWDGLGNLKINMYLVKIKKDRDSPAMFPTIIILPNNYLIWRRNDDIIDNRSLFAGIWAFEIDFLKSFLFSFYILLTWEWVLIVRNPKCASLTRIWPIFFFNFIPYADQNRFEKWDRQVIWQQLNAL